MVNEYFYEIIALIVVLTSIIIYFLVRRFDRKEENDLQEVAPKKTEIIDETHEENIPLENENNILTQKESLENIQANSFEEKSTPLQNPSKALRQRCEVPSHGKITKENFKDFHGVKLLVAEDNLINQKVISGLLSNSGIEVTMADDGRVALDILEKNSDFDMIIMDVHMPRIDGFEATKIIRANPKYEHIVVVALSGDIATDDIRKMNEAGMQEHLEKPLRMDSFYNILYAYTQSNNSHDNLEFIEVIMTKELNGDKGLEVCGGDEVFYKDILLEFTQTYTNTSNELIELLTDKNIERADELLLDFIGITANIGADAINTIARELKEAIKDLEEDSYITILDEFEVHLQRLLKDIAAYK
ncbi:MAG: response regulator [Sulfurovum sp.]|nr:response regulator [Sulfurovum sp.]